MTESPTKLDEAFIWAELERAYLEGDLYSLITAVEFCHTHARPLPKWAADGVNKVLIEVFFSEGNRKHGGLAFWTRNFKHAQRWKHVVRLREMPPDAFKAETGFKKSWNKTFEAVAQMEMDRFVARFPLDCIESKTRDKLARGELVNGENVKKSYQKVGRDLRANKGARYFARYLGPYLSWLELGKKTLPNSSLGK
jgi:hypothetical protein